MNLLKMQLNSITIMDLFAFGGAAVGIIVVLMQFAAGSVGFAGAFTIVFLGRVLHPACARSGRFSTRP